MKNECQTRRSINQVGLSGGYFGDRSQYDHKCGGICGRGGDGGAPKRTCKGSKIIILVHVQKIEHYPYFKFHHDLYHLMILEDLENLKRKHAKKNRKGVI